MGNGVAGVFTYDLNNRITRIQHADEWSTALFDVSHGYDPVGNRLWTQDNLRAGRDELFTYDNLNRLRSFQRGTLNAPRTAIETPLNHAFLPNQQIFTLDRNGNWDQFDSSLGVPPVTVNEYREVNAVNEYLTLTIGQGTPQSLTHDDNGNLTYDPTAWNYNDTTAPTGRIYEYDEENRLTAVRRGSDAEYLQEYVYDALGRRIETWDYTNAPDPCGFEIPVGGQTIVTRHVYAGLETLEEHVLCDDGNSQEWRLAREFIWGDRFPEPLAMIDHTGLGLGVSSGGGEEPGEPETGPAPYHYLHDALGSVVALTDASQAVVERYSYDPYGKTYIEDPSTGARRSASAYGNPFMWTAQRYDAGVKLYAFPFRSYSPEHGRWLQRDPLGYVDGVNMYEYVCSMPTFFIDSFGLLSIMPPFTYPMFPGAASLWQDDSGTWWIVIYLGGVDNNGNPVYLVYTYETYSRLLGWVTTPLGTHPKSITGDDLAKLIEIFLLQEGKAVILKLFKEFLGRLGVFIDVLSLKRAKELWEMYVSYIEWHTKVVTIKGRSFNSIIWEMHARALERIYYERGNNPLDQAATPGDDSIEDIAGKLKGIIDECYSR